MNRPPAAEILILAGRSATAARWASMLEGPPGHIWLAAEDVPDPARLDLVLTDREAPKGERGEAAAGGEAVGRSTPHGPLPPAFREGVPDAARPGVIRIGAEGPADVRLPADVSQRELRLACRLLAEVVRLRRKDYARTETHVRLAEEALTDPLTGLPNRRAWDRVLPERVAAAAGTPGRLCLAIVDLDHFKPVNDTHGHAAGDAVLRAAGAVISGGLRENDFIARLGGDEFGLLLCVPGEATARAVVDRVRGSLLSGLARHGAHAITASAGFELLPATGRAAPLPSPDALFAAADTALREAKGGG